MGKPVFFPVQNVRGKKTQRVNEPCNTAGVFLERLRHLYSGLRMRSRHTGTRTRLHDNYSPTPRDAGSATSRPDVSRELKLSREEAAVKGAETMAEELAKQLAGYKAQLQQVETALSANGENEDLLKLRKDLQEVIELTKDLLSSQPSEAPDSSDDITSASDSLTWKVGDRCMSVWTEDGQWYEAEIEEIDEENGTAAITFLGYGNAEVTSLLNLKPLEEGRKAKEDSGSLPMSKKEMIAQQREYKKKKALKKAQRIKELEQEREDQKVKWQQFNNKAYSKNKKGQVKRSIFASPESVTGKVGVGTCGIADKPMTQYQDTSKYNVRHLMPQ